MEIQNFRNDEFGSLRVIQNEKGEMMFCLADVCKALGIGNPSQMKTRLDDGYIISSEMSVLAELENILRLCRTLVEMQPKADYSDAVLLSDDSIADDLGN